MPLREARAVDRRALLPCVPDHNLARVCTADDKTGVRGMELSRQHRTLARELVLWSLCHVKRPDLHEAVWLVRKFVLKSTAVSVRLGAHNTSRFTSCCEYEDSNSSLKSGDQSMEVTGLLRVRLLSNSFTPCWRTLFCSFSSESEHTRQTLSLPVTGPTSRLVPPARSSE